MTKASHPPAPKKTGKDLCKQFDKEDIDAITEVGIEGYEDFLMNPKFFDKIITELGRTIVGEKLVRKTTVIYACMSLVENSTLTSNNLLASSVSGSGKDWVIGESLKIFPDSMITRKSRLSEMVLTYLKPPTANEDWTGHILYLEDVSSKVMNSEVMKVFLSGVLNSAIVINNEAVNIDIKGKPTVIMTSASSTPHNENVRRLPTVTFDDTPKQTQRITNKKCENAVKGVSEIFDNKISKSIGKLKRVKVKIPFAMRMTSILSDQHIITRTNITRVLDLVKSSTALHQYQRKEDTEGFLLATEQDYEIAKDIWNHSLQNEFGIPLTAEQKRTLDALKDANKPLSLDDLEKAVPTLTDQQLRRMLDKLASAGLVRKDKFMSNAFGNPKTSYAVITNDKKEMPKFQKLPKEVVTTD